MAGVKEILIFRPNRLCGNIRRTARFCYSKFRILHLFYFSMIVVFITSLIIVKKKMPDFFKFSNNSLLISADKWKITLSRPIFWSFVITVIMVAVMY